MLQKHTLFCLALLCFSAVTAAQSPWAHPKGGGYAQLSWNYIPTYTTLFGADDQDIVLEREVSERNLQFYGEYGIGKHTTLITAIPLVMNERGEVNTSGSAQVGNGASGQLTGLGNTTLGIKHQFLRGRLALAGTLKLNLPAGSKYLAEADLRTGYDAVTLIPSVNLGMGLGRVYWFAYGGYGYRSNDFSHFVTGGAEIGARLGPVWLGAFTETIYPLENGDKTLPDAEDFTGLYIDNQGWVSMGFKAAWAIKPSFGINVSGAGAAWAQNVPKSPGISFGAWYRWGQ
ncbi:MAG: hypothetical protein IT261_05000 [Saprospiraceae bacterium]|nr:hypothetical protein [Saprospiraceae bacterium]